ncbi:MAG: low molecular weight phosphotyrosine protein phosphatase [Flavobacteriales bacterium]|jgi:protein-tyrosine phosphatase|nr:low molecular weight phosphotyrosine protein phosphatase [Flavobacteriales bacterium]
MKILMVCLGNICRSPLAHGILEKKIEQHNLNAIVDSAGTGSWHIGNPPDIRSIEIAKKNGVSISDQRARQFIKIDFEEFDLIYVMDKNNLNDLSNLDYNNKYSGKIKLILNEINPSENMDVPDPYYGDNNGFKIVYDLLENACDKIILKLKNE